MFLFQIYTNILILIHLRLFSAIIAVVLSFVSYLSYKLHCCALPDKRCLSHGMLPLSGHDDVALFE